jgi:cupin 2 domain-containing protein
MMWPTVQDRENLFASLGSRDAEVVDVLLTSPASIRIERIVSRGQASPPGFWYDQDQDEWVTVLVGRARLDIEGRGIVELGPGDHVHLPAHLRHRVEWTDPGRMTVWLAVFWDAGRR